MRDDKMTNNHNPVEVEQQEWKKRQLKERMKQMLTIASPIFLAVMGVPIPD